MISENYQYTSKAEIEIDNLIKGASNQDEIKSDLIKIKSDLAGLFDKELEIYKSEILRETKSELAARYLGMEGRIQENLNQDEQIQAALLVLSDNVVYNQLLNVH